MFTGHLVCFGLLYLTLTERPAVALQAHRKDRDTVFAGRSS